MHHFRRKRNCCTRIAACFFALFFLVCSATAVLASPEASTSVYPPPVLKSGGALVYNLQYDKVLFEQNATTPVYPASFAKVMTALLCYEHLEKLGTSVSVTVNENDDLSVNGLGLEVGETLDFVTLLNAMVIGSANDAAMVLARVVDGDVESFVAHMNERAKELGCENTLFANPTGLHNGAAQTTLSDMQKICARAYEINDYMQTASQRRFEVPATNKHDKVRVVTNSNHLINPNKELGYYVEGAMGINHGYTAQSGYCVCSVRETAGAINLVLVTGGSKTEDGKNTALTDAGALFEYAQKAFEINTILEKESVIQEVPVRLSDTQDHVLLIAADNVTALLPVGFNSVTDLEKRVFLTEKELEAPIVEGTSYGSVELYFRGELIGSADLVAQRSLARSDSLALLNSVENFLQLPPVRTILIVLACVIALFLAVCILLLYLQRRRKSGISPKERRERKRMERELLKKEKARQKSYFQARSIERKERGKVRKQHRKEAFEEFKEARARYLKAQAEAERRAEQTRRRQTPQNPRPATPARRATTPSTQKAPASAPSNIKTKKAPQRPSNAPAKRPPNAPSKATAPAKRPPNAPPKATAPAKRPPNAPRPSGTAPKNRKP